MKEHDTDDIFSDVFGFTDVTMIILQWTNDINNIFEMLFINKINDEVKKIYLSEPKIITLLLNISSSKNFTCSNLSKYMKRIQDLIQKRKYPIYMLQFMCKNIKVMSTKHAYQGELNEDDDDDDSNSANSLDYNDFDEWGPDPYTKKNKKRNISI